MKKLLLILLLLTVVLYSCTVAKPLPVKIEFIEKVDNGTEVWVKYHNPHYRYGSYHLVKTFDTLPPDFKIGKEILLLPKKDTSGFKMVYK